MFTITVIFKTNEIINKKIYNVIIIIKLLIVEYLTYLRHFQNK